MAKQSLNTLKQWFKKGLKPLSVQFWHWMDSYWHKDEKIPAATIEGLQGLLDTKVDKKDAVSEDQVGQYDPAKNYVYDAARAEYVSFSNPESPTPQFTVEGFYRLVQDAPAGENPETHPAHWAYQGTVIGEITMEDVVGLREELDWLSENAKSKEKAYTIDFSTTSDLAQEINMYGAGRIESIVAKNVAAILLTYSGGVQVPIDTTAPAIDIQAGEMLIWEIQRTADRELAALGVKLLTN